MKERLLSDDKTTAPKLKAKRKEKKIRRHKHKDGPLSFAQKLRDTEPRTNQPSASKMSAQEKSDYLPPCRAICDGTASIYTH